MRYRYYINDIEVFPKGDWSIKYQRNEGQIFFRRIFDGELTFMGDDYDLITSLDCEIAAFDIYCSNDLFWQGQFQFPYKVKFDADSCVVVLTPEVVDEYSCIMDKYNIEYDYTVMAVGPIAPIINDCAGGPLHTLPNCYRLGMPTPTGGVNAYLNETINRNTMLNCGLTMRSSFMWRDDFPNGDNYAATYGTNNYITGALNKLEYIYLLRNVAARTSLGGTTCDSATQEFSFKDWETFLRIAFNAYWFIDENGAFRVEHIHYFDPDFAHSDYTLNHDLTRVMDKGGRSFAYRKNKYEYDTGRLYDQERWSWQYYEGTEGGLAHGSDFQGVPIFYGAAENQKSDYVPGDFKEKEFANMSFWSDITWAWGIATNPPNAAGTGQPDTIGCPGFCFLDVDTGTSHIRCETGALSGGANILNGHCSTANLLNHYHQYDRIFLTGDMNSGDVTTFQTAQKHKLQDPVEFPICCDESFDPLNPVRTELGDGQVKAATRKQNSLEVELWHEFDC